SSAASQPSSWSSGWWAAVSCAPTPPAITHTSTHGVRFTAPPSSRPYPTAPPAVTPHRPRAPSARRPNATARDETVLSSVLPHDRGYRRIDPSEIRALRGPRRTTMSTVRSTALWCAICLLSTGCEQWISAFTGQETGDEVAFGDGTARTYL